MDPELEAADPATAAAWAVVLAHVLPEVKEQARRGAYDSLADGEPARLLAEAETVARLVGTGAAGLAQEHAAKLAREAVEALPAGRLPAGLTERAVAAAGSVARVRCLAEGLDGAEHAAALARWAAALRADREAAVALLDETALRRARTAATARAGVSALAARRPQLERAAELVKRQLVDEYPPDGRPAAAGLRRRLADARRRRERRAAELVERLPARVGSGPPEVTRPAWAEPELLDWLRGLTHPGLYTAETERALAAWYGDDPFGLRELPPPPPFLAGTDLSARPAEHLAPLLRRLSLTRPAPTAEELTPEALAREPGPVSPAVRTAERRRWGRPPESGAPLLPGVTRIPHVVHGIWLGGPMPRTTVFRTNYARAARRYAGQVDFVVWTDVPREAFAAVRAEPAPPRGRRDRLAAVRSMHTWAVENGIHLVNVAEVFHADAPMKLHVPYVLEMSKQLPRGYASASDHLRVDIIDRLGGMYADGDVVLASSGDGPAPEEALPRFLDRIAGSVLGFTMNPATPAELGVCNDIIVAPAGHPALALWAERARLNYARTQRELFGGLDAMAAPFVGAPGGALRYIAPCRSGRIHHEVLREAGIARAELPPTESARGHGSELSWARPLPADGGPARRPSVDEVVSVLARCAGFLCWQLIAREGDLYLATVDQVIRRLPAPVAAWTALLRVMAGSAGSRPEVTSVTDARRKDEGGFERVILPPEAERLLDRTARPDRWLGAPLAPNGQPTLLLDELVSPVRLRSGPLPDCTDVLAPLTEVAEDPLGRVVGLWLRAPETASVRRRAGRFGTLPAGHLGISLGSLPGADWTWDFGLHPESLARLVLAVGAAGRPVRLTVPVGGVEAQRPFARRLEQLLGQPVELVEIGAQERAIVPLLTYRPLTAFTAPMEEETTWPGTRGPAGSR